MEKEHYIIFLVNVLKVFGIMEKDKISVKLSIKKDMLYKKASIIMIKQISKKLNYIYRDKCKRLYTDKLNHNFYKQKTFKLKQNKIINKIKYENYYKVK